MNTEQTKSNYTMKATSTGKIHLVSRGSYNATPCNSRNRGFRVNSIGADWARKADASMYCSKCFPNGKPSDENISRYF